MQTPIAPTQRVFLALWPDDGVREQLAAHAEQWTWGPGCARYLPADWHVTLQFIGSASADPLAQIAANASVPVTLARHADGATPPTTCSPVVWRVQSYALVVSTGDQNQRYRVIRQYQ